LALVEGLEVVMTTHTVEWGLPPRRSTALVLIVALHALVIYAFLSVFVPPKVPSLPPPLQWHVIDKVLRPDPAPARDPFRFRPTRGQPVPVPPLPLPPLGSAENAAGPVAASSESGSLDSAAGAGPTVPLSYTATRPIDEFYPPGSIRLGEEGVSILRVCVGANGALSAAPILETSSGYSRLDAAAVKWAREALRFTPAQRDGQAIPACKGFRVTFRLRT
jgi:protein TonB